MIAPWSLWALWASTGPGNSTPMLPRLFGSDRGCLLCDWAHRKASARDWPATDQFSGWQLQGWLKGDRLQDCTVSGNKFPGVTGFQAQDGFIVQFPGTVWLCFIDSQSGYPLITRPRVSVHLFRVEYKIVPTQRGNHGHTSDFFLERSCKCTIQLLDCARIFRGWWRFRVPSRI